MTDTPPPVDDDIVGQVVERAADKAAAAAAQDPTSYAGLSRLEALAAIGALLVINIANLVITIDNRNEVNGNRRNQATICKLLEDIASPGTVDAATIAECFK